MYDFEIESIAEVVRKKGYGKVGLQFPEGLKTHATNIADRIGKASSCEVIISADPCYGACDLADEEMKKLGCDALFHFGHSEIIKKTIVPVYYMPVKSSINPVPLLSKNLDKLGRKVGLVATLQHVHFLGDVKKFLAQLGFEVYIGKARGRAAYDGQVLGCSFESVRKIADKVDSFVYIGSGNFHPIGIALATGKKTLAFDVFMNEVRDIEPEKQKILRQRFARIEKSRDAKTFGIIICWKKGQLRKNTAIGIKKMIEHHGKKAHLLYMNEIGPERLLPFKSVDAFVNTACPRVAVDDASRYKKPILTPAELEIVLGERKWSDYRMDEILR